MKGSVVLVLLFLCSSAIFSDAKKRGRPFKNLFKPSSKPKWAVHLGPLKIGSDGVKVQPKVNFGFQNRNVDLIAGVGDVRDGIKIGVDASVKKVYTTTGSSISEVLKNFDAADETVISKYYKLAFPQSAVLGDIIKEALDQLAKIEPFKRPILAGSKITATVTGRAGVRVVGVANLGWKDTEGFNMVGGVIGFEAGLGVKGGYQVGFKKNPFTQRVVITAPYVVIDIRIEYPNLPDPSPIKPL